MLAQLGDWFEDYNPSRRPYLDLLKHCLTRYLFLDEEYEPLVVRGTGPTGLAKRMLQRLLRARDVELVSKHPTEPSRRAEGRDWPPHAETMIGLRRLDNLQHCITGVIRNDVPGDLIETGVWRGGAAIFMRAVFKAHDVTDRVVWLADSFNGLPKPDAERYPTDRGSRLWAFPELAVSPDQVQRNFAKYGLLGCPGPFPGWLVSRCPPPRAHGAARNPSARWRHVRVHHGRARSPRPETIPRRLRHRRRLSRCRRLSPGDSRLSSTEHIDDPLFDIDWAAVFWQRTR